ncbi:MAG: ABC transporter substrate-binding protein [Bacteroidales bacterium]|nr:ABC transporter substrate-binding protein [Bacteroidales bacterium]
MLRTIIQNSKFRYFVFTALAILCLFAQTSIAQQQTLRVAAWAGSYTDCMVNTISDFEKEYNVKVEFIPSSSEAILSKAMTNQIDVGFTEPQFSKIGEAQGLWAKLEAEDIPNINRLVDFAKMSDYTLVTDFGIYGIAYNPKYVEQPTSWEVLWDPKYKDKVAIDSFSLESIELMILMARQYGGDEYNIDPGFEKMAELSKNVRFFVESHPQLLTAFKNEDIWFALWSAGRVIWAIGEGANVDFAIPEEGTYAMISAVNVVKNSPNVELAKKFVNWRLSDPPQQEYAKVTKYVPVVKDIELPPEVANVMPTEEEIERIQMSDLEYITSVYDEWYERWTREVAVR